MIIRDFIEVYNAANIPASNQSSDNYQRNYSRLLADAENAFDRLHGSQEIVFENENMSVSAGRDLGTFAVCGLNRVVVAQLLLDYPHRQTERILRTVGLYAVREDFSNFVQRFDLLSRQGRAEEIGRSTLDSSRRRALPSSVGVLEHFSQLLLDINKLTGINDISLQDRIRNSSPL